MSRNDAIDMLKKPAFDEQTIKHEFEYVADKLDMTEQDLMDCFNLPLKSYTDYSNQEVIYNLGSHILKYLGKELGGKR